MRERLEFFKMGTIVRARAVLNAAQVCIAIAILHSKYVNSLLRICCRFFYYTPGIRSMVWGYNVFVFSLCVCVCVCVCVSVNNFRVRSITLKPLDIFSWNFTQTINTTRRRAEYINRNSGFSTFGVIALCVLTIFVSAP